MTKCGYLMNWGEASNSSHGFHALGIQTDTPTNLAGAIADRCLHFNVFTC